MMRSLLVPFYLGTLLFTFSFEAQAAKRTFNGAYMGLSLGGTFTRHDNTIKQGNNPNADSKKSKFTYPVGFHIGAGATKKNKLYLGAEAGVSYDLSKSLQLPSPPGITIDGRTSVRRTFVLEASGKIGYNMGNFLPYATLGVVANSWKVSLPAYSQANTKVLPGLGLGGGLSYQMGKHFMMGGEYRYIISKTQKFTLNAPLNQTSISHSTSMHDVRLKLSYIP